MSVDPTRYAAGPDAVIEDVDLNEEEVRLPDGTRLTEQRAQQLAHQARAGLKRAKPRANDRRRQAT
jgi:hypothetical protein